MIRIKGYARGILESYPDFTFIGFTKPDYIPETNFIRFKIPRYFKKIIVIHNIMHNNWILRIFSVVFAKIILNNKEIAKLEVIFRKSLVISHQDNSIGLFFSQCKSIDFVYDIHGILNIQREYKENMPWSKKIFFELSAFHEKIVFSKIKFANVINENMCTHIKEKYGFKGKCLIAPDGILYPELIAPIKLKIPQNLNLPKKKDGEKWILFFGGFKKIGGVHLLVQSYIELVNEIGNVHLITIGSGQMQSYVDHLITESGLSNFYTNIKKISNKGLHSFAAMCDVIVIPDIINAYNIMIPHIKLYDAMITGKPMVVSNFKVNHEILSSVPNNTFFFSPSVKLDLKRALIDSLKCDNSYFNEGQKNYFLSHTYSNHSENLIKQLKTIIKDN